MEHPERITQPTVRLSRADGTSEDGVLLSADGMELTIALPPGNALGIVEGARIAIGLSTDNLEDDTPVLVAGVDDREDLGVFVTIDLVNRAQVARMQLGTLRDFLNQREVFRTPIQLGSVGRTRITGLDPRGKPVAGKPREAFLVDASFEGVGTLVESGAKASLEDVSHVSITVDAPALPGSAIRAERILVVRGRIRHRSDSQRGVRLGIEAGGYGLQWARGDEVSLREFVLDQQRRALARRRRVV